MVLICNNNVLTIDTFHRNRTREKTEIRDINIRLKYLKEEKYKETPYVPPPEPDLASFLKSLESMELPKRSVINLRPSR